MGDRRFRATRLLVDRSTGEGRVGTLWTGDEALPASLEDCERRRAAAAERGIEFGGTRVLDLLYASMPR